MRTASGSRVCLLCLLLGILSQDISLGQDHSGFSSDVTLALYRSSDRTERPAPATHLIASVITVPAGVNSIDDLLSSLHFVANSDAVGLMYELNPHLAGANHLKPGDSVRVFQVKPTSDNTRALADGFKWKVLVDDKLISSIEALRGEIKRSSAEAAARLSLPASGSETLRPKSIECISEVSKSFERLSDHLEDRDQPTNHEMLLQVHAEGLVLSQELTQMAAPSPSSAGIENVERVCGIERDLEIKLRGFERPRGEGELPAWPEARVRTSTIDSTTGKLVQMWRVHYVPEALLDVPMQEHQLSVVSSPAEARLPEADYVFWATKAADANTSSDRIHIPIRVSPDSKPIQVDISVREKP